MNTQLSVSKRSALLVTGLAILAALVFLYWDTYNMQPSLLPGYPGDAFFPRLIIGFCIFWNVILLARVAFAPSTLEDEDRLFQFDWLEFALCCALVIAYAALMSTLGFELTTMCFVAALIIPRLRAPFPKSLLPGLVIAAATMLSLWAVFGLFLKVPLPLTFLPLYIGY